VCICFSSEEIKSECVYVLVVKRERVCARSKMHMGERERVRERERERERERN